MGRCRGGGRVDGGGLGVVVPRAAAVRAHAAGADRGGRARRTLPVRPTEGDGGGGGGVGGGGGLGGGPGLLGPCLGRGGRGHHPV